MGRIETLDPPAIKPLAQEEQLRRAVEQLQHPLQPLDTPPKSKPETAVDEAIHRILTTQKTETAHQPSFEDVLIEMDPNDLKAVEKLKEEIEKRG